MRLKARVSGVRLREMGDEFLRRLRSIVPDGNRAVYDGTVYTDDPRFSELRACLENAGMTAWDGVGPMKRGAEYDLELRREYEPSDLAECRYVEFQPRWVEKLTTGRTEGVMALNPVALRKSKESILCEGMCFGDYYASDETKTLLEAERFIGLSFKPTRLREWMDAGGGQWVPGQEVSWADFGPPWWEMICERVMPPLSPSMTLITHGRSPQIVHPPVDPNKSYTAKEGLYTPVELHYRASAIAQVEPFDYAHNLEEIGNIAIIVSKRFYDFCQTHGLKADWVPVRIDPD